MRNLKVRILRVVEQDWNDKEKDTPNVIVLQVGKYRSEGTSWPVVNRIPEPQRLKNIGWTRKKKHARREKATSTLKNDGKCACPGNPEDKLEGTFVKRLSFVSSFRMRENNGGEKQLMGFKWKRI